MGIRNILEEGEDALRKVCRPVGEVTDHIREIIDDLTDTMRDAEGVGLAAPQVGILRRICVVEVDGILYEMVNPVITETEGDQYGEEACLSVPGKGGDVHRPQKVTVSCLDRNGNPASYTGTDLTARAFCHEIDHLDGILYVDKADQMHYYEEEQA